MTAYIASDPKHPRPRRSQVSNRGMVILFAGLLGMLAIYVDRIVWLHAGGGVQLGLANEAATSAGVCPDAKMIELKPEGETVAYRCYSSFSLWRRMWPAYESGVSSSLLPVLAASIANRLVGRRRHRDA